MRIRIPRSRAALAGMASAAVLAVAAVGCGAGQDKPASADDTVIPGSAPAGELAATGATSTEQSAAGRFSSHIGIEGAQQSGIHVTGAGTVSANPDTATLNVGVEAREETAAEARQRAAEAMNTVMEAVQEAGVDEDDIETQHFSIRPETRWIDKRDDHGSYGHQEIVGYIVTNQLTVTIKDLDQVGAVIDAAAEAAGDEIRIDGVSFSVEDRDAHTERARELAAEEAQAKARAYAESMGVELGPLVYLSESSAPQPTAERMGMEDS
ncbi:MAG: SIMPL domain-containing protein, partial [Chloroflexota bacterium]